MRGDNDEAWNFGDMGNQYVPHTIAEILLFGVVTHAVRRKNGNRGFLKQHCGGLCQRVKGHQKKFRMAMAPASTTCAFPTVSVAICRPLSPALFSLRDAV